MADKSISELPKSPGMTDDALLPVFQNSETGSISGALIKQYARESTVQYADAAAKFATSAQADAVKTAADRLVVEGAANAERGRVTEETKRVAAEKARASETAGIVAQASGSAASALAAQKAAELAANSMLRAFGPVLITLPAAGWTGTGPWTQKTPVAGVLAIWNYRLGLYAQEIADPVAEKINDNEIKSVTKCLTEDGGITAICRERRPETDLLVVLVGEV